VDKTSTVDARARLIVALDVPEIDQARRIVDELDGLVSYFKIGWHLFMVPGNDELVAGLKAAGKQVFWDYKITDINETTRGAIRRAVDRNIDFMTVNVNGAVMESIREIKENTKILYISLLTLTHMDESDLQEIGVSESISDLVSHAARRAVRIGCDGMIVSSREVARVREELVPPEFTLVTPGIRPSGVSVDDHKTAGTPRDAILRGSDYLVVGRPIIRAAARSDAASRILDEMQSAFDQRG
jgi:orotidine-5'-phosphate decarboxylase